MVIASISHVGGSLSGTIVDVTVGPQGRWRFEVRELHVGRSGCEPGPADSLRRRNAEVR